MSAITSGPLAAQAARSLAGPALWVFAAALVWLALLAGLRPLMLPDEGRYVGVAWEMLRSGDWLTPTLNGLPYFHKPPLFYWITAASMTLFGPGEWAARAAPLLGAAVASTALWLFVRRWWGIAVAQMSLVALLAQPLFYLGGQFANLDMLVAGCITLTVVLLAHAALAFEQGSSYKAALVAAYAAAALGVLAKGLIGAVLPALVIGVWLLLRMRWRTLWALLSGPGALLFFLVAAPWFLAMQARFPDFLHYFFVVQHFKRFTTGGFNNAQPFWFYPALLLLFSLPWWPWLWAQVWRRERLVASPTGLRLLMWVWLVGVMMFFSLPKSKLVGYVLPALAPLAVLVADGFVSTCQRPWQRHRGWWLSAAVAALLSVVTLVALAVRPPYSTKELAGLLRRQHLSGQPVLMLEHYYFDLPLYAGLREPAQVVLDWAEPTLRQRDSWPKELADAGDFAPELAAQVLVPSRQLRPALCAHAVSWVLGSPAAYGLYPFLAQAQQVGVVRDAALWRVEPAIPALKAALRCAETPNGG